MKPHLRRIAMTRADGSVIGFAWACLYENEYCLGPTPQAAFSEWRSFNYWLAHERRIAAGRLQ